MEPLAARVRWVGKRQPKRPWLAQVGYIEAGRAVVETLGSEHETEAAALAAARREIAKRLQCEGCEDGRRRWRDPVTGLWVHEPWGSDPHPSPEVCTRPGANA